MAQVSIIILTFNSARFIENLLSSLKDFGKDAEILVVDNASTDDTAKISKKFEHIKVVETGKNLGFAKGINFGAEKAKGDYFFFVNPDTVFEKGNLEDMVKIFESDKKIAVLGGKLIDYAGKTEKSAGKFFNLLETILIVLGLDEKLGVRFSPEKFTKVDFVSGGLMMTEAAIFKKLNGFDENFFMYVEDMEYCYRNKKAGYETYFTPDIAFSHIGQGSSNRGFAIVNIYKGLLYFFKKHKNLFEYWIVKTALLLKGITVYFLGFITNNSYYKTTYRRALAEIK